MARKKEMKRGKLTFVCVWLAIFAVCYLIWALYLGAITRSLVKYEKYGPQAAAENVFDEYFAAADAEKLASYGDLELSVYDKNDAEYEFFSSVTEKNLTYYEIDELCYEVAADGYAFACFTLIEDKAAKELFGKRPYTVGEILLTAKPSYEARIIAPKNAIVEINGVKLTESALTGESLALDPAPYFPESEDARVMVIYRIEGLYNPPAVTVKSAGGNAVYAVEYDGENFEYNTEYSYRAYLSEQYNKTIFD